MQDLIRSAAAHRRWLARRLVAASMPGSAGWRREERERGDVPGWVLITLMTAGLVTVIWAIAGDTLSTMLSNALSSVSGKGAKP